MQDCHEVFDASSSAIIKAVQQQFDTVSAQHLSVSFKALLEGPFSIRLDGSVACQHSSYVTPDVAWHAANSSI